MTGASTPGPIVQPRCTGVMSSTRADPTTSSESDRSSWSEQVEKQTRRREPASPRSRRVDAEPAAEQLPLLHVERQLVDEVAAQPLRATPEPDTGREQIDERDREAAASAERERQEQARVTLAEARRQAEAADAQRQAREAEPTARKQRWSASTSASRPPGTRSRRFGAADIQAESDRLQRDEAERQEQLNRWYDQDRAAEIDHGYDDGPSLGRDY